VSGFSRTNSGTVNPEHERETEHEQSSENGEG
jgi:hypothetical protein